MLPSRLSRRQSAAAGPACERQVVRSGRFCFSVRPVSAKQSPHFTALYARCPRIHTVLCNGGTAHALFVKSGFAGDRRVLRMPSTSPAYTMPYAKKLEIWKETLNQVLCREGQA